MQILIQWAQGGVWDSAHLTKISGDANALDLNLSIASPGYFTKREIMTR